MLGLTSHIHYSSRPTPFTVVKRILIVVEGTFVTPTDHTFRLFSPRISPFEEVAITRHFVLFFFRNIPKCLYCHTFGTTYISIGVQVSRLVNLLHPLAYQNLSLYWLYCLDSKEQRCELFDTAERPCIINTQALGTYGPHIHVLEIIWILFCFLISWRAPTLTFELLIGTTLKVVVI